ncbi:hypothetical protein [Amycolatopsis circi]|uniref:hypothetical protein n=1 Tax=Amycolatopsis circi TaxID=871959 RepID=UPI000E232889|nr:hypothetical protein [Amycolatopsis circi]
MNQQRSARTQARERARETVGRATRWSVLAGLGTAAVCGLALGIGTMTATASPAGTAKPNPAPQNVIPSDAVDQGTPQQAPAPGEPTGGYSSSGAPEPHPRADNAIDFLPDSFCSNQSTRQPSTRH